MGVKNIFYFFMMMIMIGVLNNLCYDLYILFLCRSWYLDGRWMFGEIEY